MQDFSHSRKTVLEQIEQACQYAKRNEQNVQLLAVSKTQPSDALRQMYMLGQRCFGENYLQEALTKIEQLNDLEIEWHFIGHVQRNKTKAIAEHFAWVHGVDRFIIAERLSKQRPLELPALNLCIQVNIDEQDTKDGCQPEEVQGLVEKISVLPNIQLRGLMIIPKPNNSDAFVRAQQLFEQVKCHHAKPEHWDTLSMGMSADLNEAITAGATIVRVGTALFGAR